MTNFTRSANVQALSIYNQLHNNKKEQGDQKNSHKHLLALLSSFPREDNDLQHTQIVEDLCCFDRMKKIINQNGNINSSEQQEDIINAIALQQKINQLEIKLTKSNFTKTLQKPQKPTSTHFISRSCIIADMKKGCIQKLFRHKEQINKKKEEQIKRLVDKQIDNKIDSLIEDKSNEHEKLLKEKEELKKTIYVKDLQIQGLKMKETYLREYIQELQEKCNGRIQAKKTSQKSKTNFEAFYEKYMQAFDGMTIEQVKHKLQIAINKCLNEFHRIQNKNYIYMKEQITNQEKKCEKLEEKIKILEKRENELINNIKNIKINKEISEIEINGLMKAKEQLEQIQKLIVSIYNSWYADRTESEKKLLKCSGNLSQSYSYQEMLNYILKFSKTSSTNKQLNDYLYKILRGVQRIRRVIYPDCSNQNADSLLTIQKIEKWIKIKQTQHGRRMGKKMQDGSSKQNYYEMDD